jgi:hypothetical protein
MLYHFEVRKEDTGDLIYGSDDFLYITASDHIVYTDTNDVTVTYKVERVEMRITEGVEPFTEDGSQIVVPPAVYVCFVSVVPPVP